MYRKRTLPSSFVNTPYTPPRKRSTSITLTRPTSYRTNYQYQQFLKRKNQRSGGFVGKELKFFDTVVEDRQIQGQWTLLNNTTIGCLNSPAQGNGPSERIGRKITGVSIHVKGFILSDPNTTARGNVVRIVLFRDKQTNNAAPPATGPFIVPPNSYHVNSYRNLELSSRFNVYYDRTFTLNPVDYFNSGSNTTEDNEPRIPFSINVRVPFNVEFNATDGDVSSITDDSLHMIGASIEPVNVCFNSRYRYYG